MTKDEKRAVMIYRLADKYLDEMVTPYGYSSEEVRKSDVKWAKRRATNKLNEIFAQMIDSVRNQQGYDRMLPDSSDVRIALGSLNPQSIQKRYDDDWKSVLHAFRKRGFKVLINEGGVWARFAKGVLSISRFLSHFKDGTEFNQFVKCFGFGSGLVS